MARKQPPSLSRYLRDKANIYSIYPAKLPKGVPPEDDHFGLDEFLSAIAEARRTFTHKGYTLQQDPEIQQQILDTTYCREVLKEVPDMVRRTMDLGELPLPESEAKFWVYIRESSKCLILGLSQATVALARAAMESCLREAYAQITNHQAWAVRRKPLQQVINFLSDTFPRTKGQSGLSEQEKCDVTFVITRAGGMLHDRPIEADQAVRVFNRARSVIQGVAARNVKQTKQ